MLTNIIRTARIEVEFSIPELETLLGVIPRHRTLTWMK